MHFAIVTGLPSKYMHPFQQRGMRGFPIAVIPAENIDDLVSILKGEKVSSFEDEHEIFLPRVLFSGAGRYRPENVVYELGPIHLELRNGTDGLTLWAKAVPMLDKEDYMAYKLIITRPSGVEEKEEPTESAAEMTAEDLVLKAEKKKEKCQVVVMEGEKTLHTFITMP